MLHVRFPGGWRRWLLTIITSAGQHKISRRSLAAAVSAGTSLWSTSGKARRSHDLDCVLSDYGTWDVCDGTDKEMRPLFETQGHAMVWVRQETRPGKHPCGLVCDVWETPTYVCGLLA